MSLKLKTSDNKLLEVELKKITNLKMICALLNIEDNEEYMLTEDFELPLEDIDYNTLKKIYTFCEYEYNMKDINCTTQDKFNWYNSYFTCSNEDLFNLLNGCDYLQYEYLLDMGCDRLANDIKKCDSVDSLKSKFGITKDLTEEEEKELLNNVLFTKE